MSAMMGEKLRVFGPGNCPEDADLYLGDVDGDLSALFERVREYLPQMGEDERFVIRVKLMTDAEVEGLPDA